MEPDRATLPELALAPRPLARDGRDAWGTFLRTMAWVGLNTFGGPVAQIGFMHKVAVEEKRWLSDGQFVHLLNFANVIPGPEALEIAIHLGYLRRGIAGGVAAGLLFIWPGFVTLTILAWVYQTYGHVPAIAGFLDGVRPVAIALVAAAAVRISKRALKGRLSYAVMTAAFLASYILNIFFVGILVGCGLLGLTLGRHRRDAKQSSSARSWMALHRLGRRLRHRGAAMVLAPGAGSRERTARGAGSTPAPGAAGDLGGAADGRRLGQHQGGARHLRWRVYRPPIPPRTDRRSLRVAERPGGHRWPRARRDDAGAAHLDRHLSLLPGRGIAGSGRWLLLLVPPELPARPRPRSVHGAHREPAARAGRALGLFGGHAGAHHRARGRFSFRPASRTSSRGSSLPWRSSPCGAST